MAPEQVFLNHFPDLFSFSPPHAGLFLGGWQRELYYVGDFPNYNHMITISRPMLVPMPNPIFRWAPSAGLLAKQTLIHTAENKE